MSGDTTEFILEMARMGARSAMSVFFQDRQLASSECILKATWKFNEKAMTDRD